MSKAPVRWEPRTRGHLPLDITNKPDDDVRHLRMEPVPLPMPEDGKKVAFTIDNVLSKTECEEWIKYTEDRGYEMALVNVGGGRQVMATDIRNSSRCIVDDEKRAAEIFRRIRHFIPEVWKGRRVVGLNERLRFLRYDPGEYFKAHFDGAYQRPDGPRKGERTFITVQVYLNGGFEGGATTFLPWSTRDDVAAVDCVPAPGRVLVFQHDILHRGSELLAGRKYALRCDVLYEPENGYQGGAPPTPAAPTKKKRGSTSGKGKGK